MSHETAKETEVLPCPWCGDTPEIVETIHESYNLIHRCDQAETSIKIEKFDRDSVLEKWNARQYASGSSSPVAAGNAPQVAISPAGTLHAIKKEGRDGTDVRTLCGRELDQDWLTCIALNEYKFPERGVGDGRPICGVCAYNMS